jgi:hypothetical protein
LKAEEKRSKGREEEGGKSPKEKMQDLQLARSTKR